MSRISKSFFREITRAAQERKLHKRFGKKARNLAERFKLREITGLDVPNALQLVEDLVDIHIQNVSDREHFILLDLIDKYKRQSKQVKASFSVSGVFLEQCEVFNKDLLESFKQLAETGCEEFLS